MSVLGLRTWTLDGSPSGAIRIDLQPGSLRVDPLLRRVLSSGVSGSSDWDPTTGASTTRSWSKGASR